MLDSILNGSLTMNVLLISIISAIILGFIIAFTHKLTSKYNKNFLITLSLIPLSVEAIMIMVNGSLGTGIAVAGAFSLIRFRSIPGTSREILSIFISMTVGLILGMGYIGYAVIITLVTSLFIIIFNNIKLFDNNKDKILKITIPENLDYNDVFDVEFKEYLNTYEIINVKTTNMGSLFELTYLVKEKDNINEKDFIDKLRVKNGNLKINLSKPLEENNL